MANLRQRKESVHMNTIKAIAPFEMKEIVQVKKDYRGKTVVKPHGWFAFEPGKTMTSWYKPEDASAKPLSKMYDEQEPVIEAMSIQDTKARIDNFKKKGLQILNGPVNEMTPEGYYVIR